MAIIGEHTLDIVLDERPAVAALDPCRPVRVE